MSHSPAESSPITVTGRRLLLAWLALSALFFTWMLLLILRDGSSGFYYLQGPADPASTSLRFVVFMTGWLMTGAALVLTQVPDFTRRNAAFLLVLALILFEYLILLREPHPVREGDFSAYFDAARAMRDGVAINQNVPRLYLYPPLLATLLQPLVPFGLMPVLGLFKLGSQVMLAFILVGSFAALRKLPYSKEAAAIALLVVFSANAPLHHNFVYSQVNAYVLASMLASLVAYPRFRALSAAALAIGVHLKVYPVMLALPFLLIRDWKWLFWFGVSLVALVIATSLANDFKYYGAFLHEIATLREDGLRTSSVDSLIHNTLRLTGLGLAGLEKPLANLLRVLLAGWALVVSYRFMMSRVSGESIEPMQVVLRGYTVLPLAMLIASPSQWPHHFVLIIPAVLMLLPYVRPGTDLLLFGVAYLLIFLAPINEIYPFSYLRLAGIIMLVLVSWRAATNGVRPAEWFVRLSSRLSPEDTARNLTTT